MTDHCTLWFEGTWAACCKRHDKRYESTRLTRLQADRLMYRCVKRKSNVINAIIMFIGVRLGGWTRYNKDK